MSQSAWCPQDYSISLLSLDSVCKCAQYSCYIHIGSKQEQGGASMASSPWRGNSRRLAAWARAATAARLAQRELQALAASVSSNGLTRVASTATWAPQGQAVHQDLDRARVLQRVGKVRRGGAHGGSVDWRGCTSGLVGQTVKLATTVVRAKTSEGQKET